MGHSDWQHAMHDGNCRGSKAVLAFCFLNCCLCHLPKNQSIHSAHGNTTFEMFHGGKSDLSHIHVFECQSFVLNEVRKKLDSKVRDAFLLGFWGNSKAYAVASTYVVGHRQGHQRSGCHETSVPTTMTFRIIVVLQSPKRNTRTMMRLKQMLMI